MKTSNQSDHHSTKILRFVTATSLFDGRKSSPSEGVELSRGTEKERENQLRRLREFHRIHERQEKRTRFVKDYCD